MKQIQCLFLFMMFSGLLLQSCRVNPENIDDPQHEFNDVYAGEYLDRIAFPIGGIGAGMFCLEGTGAISHMSVRSRPEMFNEPCMFAAVSVKGIENGAKILEGQVPEWKHLGQPGSGNGSPGASYGLPHFDKARFLARFPFAKISLSDEDLPLEVTLKGWSPFIPTDADNSSLPVGSIEYTFHNTGSSKFKALFSCNARNFMKQTGGKARVKPIAGGFILAEEGTKENPEKQSVPRRAYQWRYRMA